MSDQQSAVGEDALDSHFRAMAHHRRRELIRILSDHDGSLTIYDLAKMIALDEQETNSEDIEKFVCELYHRHVPILAGCELVTYEEKCKVVELTDDGSDWISFLNTVEGETSQTGSKQSCR